MEFVQFTDFALLSLSFFLFLKISVLGLEFVDVLVSVDGRTIFVFLLSGNQDDQEDEQAEQAEQAEYGDTHRNETCLVRRELMVVVFGAGPVDADNYTVRIRVYRARTTGPGVLEDDEIFVSFGEIEFATPPDEHGAILDEEEGGDDGCEVHHVCSAGESGGRATTLGRPDSLR